MSNESDRTSQHSKSRQHRRDLDLAYAELKRANERITNLQKTVDILHRQLQQCREKVAQNARESTSKETPQLANEDIFGPQATDQEVRMSFNALFSNLKKWTRHFRSGKDIDPQILDLDLKEMFKNIVPGFDDKVLENIMDSRSKTRYFIQAWLSLVVTVGFFPSEPDGEPLTENWDKLIEESVAKGILSIEEAFIENDISLQELSNWRACTANLLLKGSQPSDEEIKACFPEASVELMKVLGTFCYIDDEKGLESELSEFLIKANKFSNMIKIQRAQWTVTFPYSVAQNLATKSNTKIPYDPTTMTSIEYDEEDENGDHKIVEIFVTPALFKRGNADGSGFDTKSVIERSAVLWRDSPVKRTPRAVQVQKKESASSSPLTPDHILPMK